MRWSKSILLALVAIALPLMALGQFDTGGSSQPRKPAWEEFPLNASKTITLSFRNANIDSIIDLYSRASGITIIKDPQLKEPLTVVAPKPVGLKEAFSILNTAMSLRGFELEKQGNALVIKKKQERRESGMTPEMIQQMMGQNRDQNELKVYRIEFANAASVARVVNEVFENQQSQNPLAALFGGGRNRGGRSSRGGFSFGGSSGSTPTVQASSDDFSNSVIVNAPKDKQLEVEALIEQIDQQTEAPQRAVVYKLDFAIASNVAPIIQNVLTSNAPTGRGGQGQQNIPLSQRFSQAARFGNFSASFGTVIADDYTNSLVVTATDENQRSVAQVIQQLDVEVEVVNTTFVIPLNNAPADQLADVMQQAFGSRGNNRGGTFGGGFGGFNFGGRGNNNRNRNTRGGGRNNRGGGFGRAPSEDPNAMELDFEDPEAEAGELMTQFRFGGFGGGNQNSGNQLTRGSDGRLVNTQDLTGQITVIPDPNTNSLIVVTDPANYELVRQIIEQLDRVPEQVMIETMIVEATLDESTKLGVEWELVQAQAFGADDVTGNLEQDLGLTAADQGFRYTLAGDRFNTFLNALKTDDKFQVLSTPRIFTSNNTEAEINISQSIPYVLSTREDNNGNLTFNYAFQDVGIVLTVTPRISANGQVTLDVIQTANDLQGFTDFNAPIVNQRQAETTVTVGDGETIILGGIMRTLVTSNVKKIPLLGDIPILGELFKTRTTRDTKTELLVFLTPRVVRDAEDARKLREETENELSGPMQKTINDAKSAKTNAMGGGKADKNNKIGN